jgi:hypothetical protein
MQTKNLTVTEMGESGKGLALIADLTGVDSDGDSYEPGAFSWKEQWVPLLPAHNRFAMPFGKARVFEDGDAAYAELHLNLDTQVGKEWHSALQFDLKTGNAVQEWSYGYDAMRFDKVMRGLAEGRHLKQLDVQEVSTVVRGAGRGTRTVDMKGLKAAMKDGDFSTITQQLGVMAATIDADPAKLSATGLKQLGEIHANLGTVIALANRDPEAEEKAAAEIERMAGNAIARDAIRRAEAFIG